MEMTLYSFFYKDKERKKAARRQCVVIANMTLYGASLQKDSTVFEKGQWIYYMCKVIFIVKKIIYVFLVIRGQLFDTLYI